MNSKTTRSILVAVMVASTTVACAVAGKHSASARYSIECTAGGTFVDVSYGDSELKVHPIAMVHRGAALKFRLRPNRRRSDKVDYENTEVTIEGKTPDASWINTSGSFSDSNGDLTVCVPEGIDRKTYYYFITVDEVGTLDPRADVTM